MNMAHDNTIVQINHNMDLNTFFWKDHGTEIPEENLLNLYQLTSPYSDMDNLSI